MRKLDAVSPAAAVLPGPVERARGLQPLIAEYADTAEREGRIAPPLFEALKAAGLFRITAARRVGGAAATTAVDAAYVGRVVCSFAERSRPCEPRRD